MSSPPRVSVEQSEFKKLKEEMGNLRGVKNESDFDWELSSGDEGYSNDDFELSTPKRETPGSSLKRTNTEELNDMFGGINLFPSSKSTNSELNNLSSDSSFMRDIENELQDALEDFSADRKEKLKSDVAVAEKGILKEQEEARTKRQRRKDSIELAAKTGRENLALLKDEKRKLTRENQRLTAALAAESATLRETCEERKMALLTLQRHTQQAQSYIDELEQRLRSLGCDDLASGPEFLTRNDSRLSLAGEEDQLFETGLLDEDDEEHGDLDSELLAAYQRTAEIERQNERLRAELLGDN